MQNGMCRISSNLPRNLSIGPKRNDITFCGLKRVKLFFSDLVVIDSMSEDPRVLNLSLSTLWRLWSMMVQKSWYGDVFHTTVLGLLIVFQVLWISLNTSKYLKRLCFPMPKRKFPSNGCCFQTHKYMSNILVWDTKDWGNWVASSIPWTQHNWKIVGWH